MFCSVGIAAPPPKTMADLELATAPSKSIITTLWLPTATSNPMQPKHQQTRAKNGWKLQKWGHCHPSTQSYARMHDDPHPALTKHQDIAMPTVDHQQASLLTSTQKVNQRQRTDTINAIPCPYTRDHAAITAQWQAHCQFSNMPTCQNMSPNHPKIPIQPHQVTPLYN